MELSYSSFRLKAETDSLMLGRWEKWKSRRSCGISKRSGKVLPSDFSAERLFPRPFYPRIVLKTPIFEVVYRRTAPRLGYKQTIGAVAHRQCRLIWKILHQGVRYEERGPAVSKKSKQTRAARMIRELRSLGYRVEPASSQLANAR